MKRAFQHNPDLYIKKEEKWPKIHLKVVRLPTFEVCGKNNFPLQVHIKTWVDFFVEEVILDQLVYDS